MPRLLGINPYLRALIGVAMLVFGIVTKRPLLIGVGVGVGAWSIVTVVVAAKSIKRRDQAGR